MLSKSDINSFFADENINLDDYVVETYFFETPDDPRLAAASLCSEKSTAQWSMRGSKEDYRAKHGAKVLDLKILGESKSPIYDNSGADPRGNFKRCEARIANPHINFGAKIPNMLTTAAGEGAFYSPCITTIKLLDLEFPKTYLSSFAGPKFGVKGLRKILEVEDRPIFFGVVKPNVGLPIGDFANLAFEAWCGGLDAAKDDEMLADAAYSPLEARVKAVCELKEKAEDLTGRPKMFVANITDEVELLIPNHDCVVRHGANAVMVNVFAVGLSATRWLCSNAKVPVVAHFDFIAPFSRMAWFGVSTCVATKLQRLCGCDAIIMPGFGGRMQTSDDEVKQNSARCLTPWSHIRDSLPVPGGSDWAGTLGNAYEKLGTKDFGFVPGRGVFGHPKGPGAGAKSLLQAWDAIASGKTLSDASRDCPELKSALSFFGK